MLNPFNLVISKFWVRFVNYLPDFFAGLLILIVGIILSGLVKKLFLSLLSFFRLRNLLEKSKIMEKSVVIAWEEIIAEILRWTVVILFLIPTLEAWGLSKATEVLNQFLFYLPNVIIAVIIGFVGLMGANLLSDLVRTSFKAIGSAQSATLSTVAKSITMFFTVLIVLNQLGVAQDLIRILFTGIVAMIAIAGGLSFGLGGQQTAKDILEKLKEKLK